MNEPSVQRKSFDVVEKFDANARSSHRGDQRDGRRIILAVKNLAAAVLCSAFAGRIIERVTGEILRIPSVPRGIRAVTIYAPRKYVSPRMRASLFWGVYEAQEIRYVDRYVPPDLPVIELGSGLGVVAAHVGRKLRSGERLICVEANAGLLGPLRRNVLANAPDVNLAVVHAAVDYSGVASVAFHHTADVIEGHVSAIGRSASDEVPVVTLGMITDRYGISEYVLVCDVEGSEAGLILRDRDALEHCRLLVIELHTTTFAGTKVYVDQMADLIKSRGFALTARRGPVCVFQTMRSLPSPVVASDAA